MQPHSWLWHYLWIGPSILGLMVVVLMFRQKVAREFPMFTAYLIVEAVHNLLLFGLDHAASVTALQYWTVHWIGLVISIVLRFAIIYEIFAHLFKPYPALDRFSRIVTRWVAGLLLLAAVGVAAYYAPDPVERIQRGVFVADCAVSLMQAGLVLFLFAFSSYFRLSWKSKVFGIAMGLGVFSVVSLGVTALGLSGGGTPGSSVISFVSMATYQCCVLIWLVYMLSPERVQAALPELPSHNLEDWNQELQRLLAP